MSIWFKRFIKECKAISPHIRIKRVKMGFYRIYWKDAYLHEVYEDMPFKGYDIETEDPRLENKSYYEEYEDNVSLIRTIKNYVEGYYDSIDTIKTRVYMLRNDKEFAERSHNAYKQVYIK
jgi:hypothetical protein